jgi:integrase
MSTAFRSVLAEPEQMPLFEFAVDLTKLRTACEVIMGASRAANTEIAYRSSWKAFRQWCASAGRSSLPCSADTLLLWATELIESGKRISTVRVKLSGVAAHHMAECLPSPFDDRCRLLLSNSARLKRERPTRKRAITVGQLQRMISVDGSGPALLRDRAISTLGFALGWRRSELSSLDMGDVRIEARGVIVTLGASKTDQLGEGRVVAIPRTGRLTCPVAALEKWIKVRGHFSGPIFTQVRNGLVTRDRLSGRAICCVIHRMILAIGEDPSEYGAHSLRAGMITAAAEAGATDLTIMSRSGHRSVATILGYIRPTEGFRRDALAGVL